MNATIGESTGYLEIKSVTFNSRTRDFLPRPDAVCGMIIDPISKKLLISFQSRPATCVKDSLHLSEIKEFPAGIVEENESPHDAIIREIKEETNLDVKIMLYLGVFYTSPGITNERLHLYICEPTIPNQQVFCQDPDEQISSVWMRYSDIMFYLGRVDLLMDLKTMFLLNYSRNFFN